jgi:Asp/Glu/hydantoin racemase
MPTDPFLGLLMLDTRFPRPRGDVGHPQTFGFPVRRIAVGHATPQRVVREDAEGLVPALIDAARELVEQGAAAIGTSCGFLGLHQRRFAAALTVPVATSSLLQCAWVDAILPHGQRAGILTIDAAALTPAHLAATGVAADAPIEGVDPGGEFATRLLNDEPALDVARAEAEVVAAAERLVGRHREVGAIVLECTNMPPYAAAVAHATGRPVYDVVTLLEWVWRGVARRGEGSR